MVSERGGESRRVCFNGFAIAIEEGMRARRFAVILMFALSVSARADLLETWSKRMAETEASLKEENYERALKLANRTVSEMVERLGPGEASTELFGIALTHKALAHAGLGENDEAIWYWHTVVSLYPKAAERDISVFGDPARLLGENREPPSIASPVSPDDDTIDPPKLVKRRKPKFPHGAHYYGVSGELVVEVIVTADGKVRSPRVVTPLPAATLSYAALEAVKRWQFEPARVGSTPVDVVFNLTVNYKE